MSEQEKKSGGNAGGSTVVSVEQTAALHKQPYRPIELEEDSHDPHHKRSRAPAVPSVAENLKRAEESNASGVERKEQSEELTTERKKFSAGKKISSKKRDSQPETIPMAVIDPEKKTEGKGLSQPIPPDVASMASTHPRADKEKHADEDSIAEDVAELRTPGTEAARSEWLEDEEAGGLPRCDSRASRVSRAVRQLFCCGVVVEAPSEDDISTYRHYAI